jgi:glyoxylase-like metal-dependent hydrolase (beta-lactamase superfamily II)
VAETRWTKNVGPAEITKISVGPMDNNVYFIAAGDEVAVVDAGSNEAEAVLAAIGSRSFKAILQTHNHGDHIVTLPKVVETAKVPVYAHPSDALPVASETVDDGSSFEVGGVTLKVLHTPGHTPGSVCFLLQSGGESHLFAGDTLFPGGPGNTFGDAKAFETIIGSLESKLFALPDDTHVYPGHGDDTTIGAEKPSLEEWRARGW